jgi:hypothetical protein
MIVYRDEHQVAAVPKRRSIALQRDAVDGQPVR